MENFLELARELPLLFSPSVEPLPVAARRFDEELLVAGDFGFELGDARLEQRRLLGLALEITRLFPARLVGVGAVRRSGPGFRSGRGALRAGAGCDFLRRGLGGRCGTKS